MSNDNVSFSTILKSRYFGTSNSIESHISIMIGHVNLTKNKTFFHVGVYSTVVENVRCIVFETSRSVSCVLGPKSPRNNFFTYTLPKMSR